MRHFVLLVIIFVLVSPAVAHAGSQFTWGTVSNVQIDQPVEQQTPWVDDGGPGQAWWPNDTSLWINNPTGCIWDQDDHMQWFADGSLIALTPVQLHFCQVVESTSIWNTLWGTSSYWSFSPRIVAISVRSSSATLDVRACYSPGSCMAITAAPDGHNYVYNGCVRAAYDVGDPAIVTIPGSNGGIGVVTQVTVSVTASKRASATAIVEAAGGFGDWSTYCSATVTSTVYPLKLYR